MKTLLINPNTPKYFDLGYKSGFPLGLGYIAAVLEKQHEVHVKDVGAENLTDNSLAQKISNIRPKIVGITSDSLYLEAKK